MWILKKNHYFIIKYKEFKKCSVKPFKMFYSVQTTYTEFMAKVKHFMNPD